MQNRERQLLLVRLELIAKDYDGLSAYIKNEVDYTGKNLLDELSAMELLNLYDSVLCKILR
jgi:hypothetical protein